MGNKAKRNLIASFIIVLILLVFLRFASVAFSPPGFFLDEAATGAHVIAMLEYGTNAHGEAWPLFSASLGGGYTTPVYLYPLTVWVAVFGASELSLRMFSQVCTVAAVLILALAMRFWMGRRGALVAAIVGLALPWGWLQSSIAWDPALVPLFVSTSFLGFSWMLYGARRLRAAGHILLPASLVALAYLYPPCRVTAPLLFVGAYGLLYAKQRVSLRHILTSCLLVVLVSLPLLGFMLQPEALERSRELSVFQEGIVSGLLALFFNFFALLSPDFLFVSGDSNLRHSTGVLGMLGAAAILPLLALVNYAVLRRRLSFRAISTHKTPLLLCIAAFGVLVGLAGSALTNEGQPHSLRATAAWPFMVIVLSVGWLVFARVAAKPVVAIAVVLLAVTTIVYIVDLVVWYPSRAAVFFDVPIRQQIQNGQEMPNYPNLSLEYYRNK